MKTYSWIGAVVMSFVATACGGADYGEGQPAAEANVAGSAGQTSIGGQAGASGSTQDSKPCDPGIYTKSPCCAGGVEGRQRCNDKGTAWGDCECDATGTGGSSGTGGTSGSGGSTSVGGSSGSGGSTSTGGSSGTGGASAGGSSGQGGSSVGGSAGTGGSSEVKCGPYTAGQVVDTPCCPGGKLGKQACTNEGVMSECWDCQTGVGGSSGSGGSTSTGGSGGSSVGGSAGTGGDSGTGGSTSTGGSSGTGGSTSTGGSAGVGGSTNVGGSGGSSTVKCGAYDPGSIVDTYCCSGGKLGKQVCQNTGIWSSCFDCATGTGGSSGSGGSSGTGGSSGVGGTGGSTSHDWDNDGSWTPGDCDDNNSSVRPGLNEACGNGIDDDCDGTIDEGCPVDNDHDGWSPPDDCDDANALINPQSSELCNGKDDNCNGLKDESCNLQTFYRDADGDGFGVASNTLQAQTQPAGYATKGGDCNDAISSVNPSASEACGNGVDDDCDGTIDQGCAPVITDPTLTCHFASPKPGTHTYYAFAGDDGTGSQDPMVWGGSGQPYVTTGAVWGSFSHSIKKGNEVVLNIVADPPSPNPATDWQSTDLALKNKFWSGTVACSTAPLGQAMNVWCELTENGITRPTARPYAVSNGQQGCNLMVVAAPSPTYGPTDSDGDGFANSGDCRSNDPSSYPGAIEVQFDGIDQNCDGLYSSPRAMVKMCGVSTSYTPTLRNVTFWGNDAPMTLVNGCHQTSWLWLDAAPREFWIEWGVSGNMSYDNSYWGGVCHDSTSGVTIKLETSSNVNVTLQKVTNQDSCHRFAGF